MQFAGDEGDEDLGQDPGDVQEDQGQDDPMLCARREEAPRLCPCALDIGPPRPRPRPRPHAVGDRLALVVIRGSGCEDICLLLCFFFPT